MAIRIALCLFLGSFLKISLALACSCSSWKNGQQAAQNPDAIVAKVETLQSNGDGSAKVKIKQVLKGQVSENEIEVLGQDGLNCNGELIHEAGPEWVLLFNKSEERYESLACADTSFPINPENQKIKFQFHENEILELSEPEFQKLLDLKALPTMLGLSCSVDVNRLVVDPNTDPHEMDFQFVNSYASPGLAPLKVKIDFSNQAPRMKIFKLGTQLKQQSPALYDFKMSVLEPFFGVKDTARERIDITRSSSPESVFINQFTDLQGHPLKDNPEGQPFMSHRTFVECDFNLGGPLVILE